MRKTASSDRNLQFDLYAQLSFMATMATAGVNRSELFQSAAELPYSSSKYFRDVSTLARRINMDYAHACRVVAERTKKREVRRLLLRTAGALSAGEDEADFLRREADQVGETLSNQYERDIESLRKWTDAYVTLLVASGLIVIVSVISMMIYQVGIAIIIALALTMVGATCLGAWIIYASAPREVKSRSAGPTSNLQRLGTSAFRVSSMVAVSTSALLLAMSVPLGWVFIVSAIITFPAGWIIKRDDKTMGDKDDDVATVVRVLGGVTSALGTTLSETISKVDRRSMGALMPEMTRLRYRLAAGIEPDLCWNALIEETGSELVDRTVTMFWNALRLGGDPAKVGLASSAFASRIAFLRATRSMVASTFRWLSIPLHTAMVALLLFIVEVMRLFTVGITENSEGLQLTPDVASPISTNELFTFGQVNIQLVNVLVTFVILVLTGANAFAPKAAEGGHNIKVVYYLAISMGISGFLMVGVPVFARTIFDSIVTQPIGAGG